MSAEESGKVKTIKYRCRNCKTVFNQNAAEASDILKMDNPGRNLTMTVNGIKVIGLELIQHECRENIVGLADMIGVELI